MKTNVVTFFNVLKYLLTCS